MLSFSSTRPEFFNEVESCGGPEIDTDCGECAADAALTIGVVGIRKDARRHSSDNLRGVELRLACVASRYNNARDGIAKALASRSGSATKVARVLMKDGR